MIGNNKGLVAYLGGCIGFIALIVTIISIFFPGYRIIDLLAVFFTIQNLIYAICGMVVVVYLVWIYSVPTNIRKLIVTLSFLGVFIAILYAMNNYFRWGWNFPDVFGVVSGGAGLTFALLDRYVGSRQSR